LKTPRITKTTPAGDDHQVLWLTGGEGKYRRAPCSDCPWRVDATGEFPAEAFIAAAGTSYDMSTSTFSCHESGKDKPATCAGYLLRSSHNLSIRMRQMRGVIDLSMVNDGGHVLHDDYRAMAIANGVNAAHPALTACR
jgi:hypothetical protein